MKRVLLSVIKADVEGMPRTFVYEGKSYGKVTCLTFTITVDVMANAADPHDVFRVTKIEFGDDCRAETMAELMKDVASRFARMAEVMEVSQAPIRNVPMAFAEV